MCSWFALLSLFSLRIQRIVTVCGASLIASSLLMAVCVQLLISMATSLSLGSAPVNLIKWVMGCTNFVIQGYNLIGNPHPTYHQEAIIRCLAFVFAPPRSLLSDSLEVTKFIFSWFWYWVEIVVLVPFIHVCMKCHFCSFSRTHLL